MSPSSPAEDFAEVLRLVMSRLNLSRVELAHRLGVDKSVVRRWARGSTRPTATNLSVLTELAAAEVPAFTRDHWQAEPAEVAALLGLTGTDPAPSAAAGLEGLLSRFVGRPGERDAVGQTRHGGVWAMVGVAGAVSGRNLTFCGAVRFSLQDGRLWTRFSDGAAGMTHAEGPAFLADNRLWVMAERLPQGSDAVVLLLDSTPNPGGQIIDGLYLVRSFTTGSPVAGRCLLFRMTDGADAATDAAVFDTVAARAGRLSPLGLADALPAWAFEAIYSWRPPTPELPIAVGIPQGRNLTSVTLDLDVPIAEGHSRGDLLAALQALFRG